MKYLEALETIIRNGSEFDAIGVLLRHIENEYTESLTAYADMSARLRAIKKINAGKNDAIDALCEEEE